MPLRPREANTDGGGGGLGKGGSGRDGAKWKYPMRKPLMQAAPNKLLPKKISASPQEWLAFRTPADPFAVAELLSSTISDLEVGC